MRPFIKKLDEGFQRGLREVKVRETLSGGDIVEATIINNNQHGIAEWDTPLSCLSVSIQLLSSGVSGTFQHPHMLRIDNKNNEDLHLHDLKNKIPLFDKSRSVTESSMNIRGIGIDWTASGAVTCFIEDYTNRNPSE